MIDSIDTREYELSKLGKAASVFDRHLPLVLVLVILPLVAEGSAYEETAASTQKYLTVGAYIGAMASRSSITVLQGGLMLGVIPVTLVGYFLLRLFD